MKTSFEANLVEILRRCVGQCWANCKKVCGAELVES